MARERDVGASSGTASGGAGTRYIRQPSCVEEKSGPISLFPYASYSEKNSLVLVAGDCCLLFIQCFCRCSRFCVDKE